MTICLMGGATLAAFFWMGHGLTPQPTQGHATPAGTAGQPIPSRHVPALLAVARAHDPLLRLPHARWFVRVRHGHAQVIVVDHALPQRDGGTVVGTGRGR